MSVVADVNKSLGPVRRSRKPPTPPVSETGRDNPAAATDRPQSFPQTLKIVDGPSGVVEHYEDGHLVAVTYERPSRVQPGWSCAAADEKPSMHHFSDASLDNLIVQKRRAVEDAERMGRDPKAGRDDLRVLVVLKRIRFRLRCRYGARDPYAREGEQGTDVEAHWLKHDEPPSYALAFEIDRRRFLAGKSHIVAWGPGR